MSWYAVEVECREQGAIGVFYLVRYLVRAESPEKAMEYAADDARTFGHYETRGFGRVIPQKQVPDQAPLCGEKV